MQRTLLISFVLLAFTLTTAAQYIPHDIKRSGVYDFIDELATDGLFGLNSVIRPYSRREISGMLQKADEQREKLNTRQQKELDFYLRDFGKEYQDGKDWDRRTDMFYYKGDKFSMTVNPILGGELFSNSSGSASHWHNGAEARAEWGNWGFFASLRDNHEKPLLGLPGYLTQREGGHIKLGTDWSEMQGGVSYGWESGYIALVKDAIQWGNNYNGANIFGGHTPTFIQLRLHLEPVEWFTFNYFHGMLNSMVVDSARSYYVTNSYGTDYREVYHKKFIASNMFSFRPFRKLWVSAGNSIVYSDYNFHPAYLVPVFFYKSVDHTYNSGIDNMNSQMFLDISSRQIKHLHLYATMFIDELSVPRIFDPDEYNFFSYKAGFHLSNLPLSNLALTAEFTYTYPLVFRHYVPTLTFETNNYNMGHYLKDNSREWFVAIDYKPVRAGRIRLFFSDAVRGPDYTEDGGSRLGNPPLESVEWHSVSTGIELSWQLINDLFFNASFIHSNTTGNSEWTADYFYGLQNTFNAGVSFGF